MIEVLAQSHIFQLRDIQKEAIEKGLFFCKSMLISAPSGGGKTLIGELCALNNIFHGYGKSIYLVPFKAIATEKYFQFRKKYSKYEISIELSIGDYDVDDEKIQKADILITTYEKMDSIIRNFHDQDWIHEISTIIIDEIHIIGGSDRGPRLESLIVRLNEFLHSPQIIGLSATIANPEFFNAWLSSLGNQSTLIKSNKRPVPLKYMIELTQNKDSTIKRITKITMDKSGQVMIFLKSRLMTQRMALNLRRGVYAQLTEAEKKYLEIIRKKLMELKGSNKELQKVIKYGIAFHHAGLLPKERKIVEDIYRKGKVKVICCTTTLSAGINMPARTVILKDFKKYITSGYNIKDFKGFHENSDGFSYFKPYSANEVFQMLGRAGRPGMDSIGYGFILVNNIEEKMWVEDHYFQAPLREKLIPKYNNLYSGLNKVNTLKEQVLLRIYEEKLIDLAALKRFFEKTYFWYTIKNNKKNNTIPIEQLLMIKEINIENIMKLHSDPARLEQIKQQKNQIKITRFTDSTIVGYVRTQYGVYSCEFNIITGTKCSCGFENGASDNFASDEFAFEFCDHVSEFLLYLLDISDSKFKNYVEDIIPKSIKNQYILNWLFDKGLILKTENYKIKCSQFGKLIIKLYLYPVSGIFIREKLEKFEMETQKDLIKEAFDILRAEYKVRDFKLLDPILEWADEEPLDDILERHKIMTGDLFSVRDNLERVITFITIISSHMSVTEFSLQDKLSKISEMAETLKIRLHYGVREELFDLVLRLNNVGRVRARILYNAGYHTYRKVIKENPYTLSRATGLGVNLCKNIIKSSKKKKKKK
ncbi:MAG: DEAD/DEAH box helicase [Promethearchaeota archaeon]